MPVFFATLDQVPPGKGSTFTTAGKDIALFNVEGTIHAMGDAWLHAAALLGSAERHKRDYTNKLKL
jgi:nitrite reductase/ring-hydroxylating ferredoxin subunit